MQLRALSPYSPFTPNPFQAPRPAQSKPIVETPADMARPTTGQSLSSIAQSPWTRFGAAKPGDGSPPVLSPREREVMDLLAKGLSNETIGQRLYISVGTVKTHVSKVFKFLGVKNRTEAAAKALDAQASGKAPNGGTSNNGSFAPVGNPNSSAPNPLGRRQQEIMKYVVQGKTHAEIAERMGIKVTSVKSQAHQIYIKLGVDNRTEAVLKMKEAGWLPKAQEADSQPR